NPFVMNSTKIAATINDIRAGRSRSRDLAVALKERFCETSENGELIYETWLPRTLSGYCNDDRNWSRSRLAWRDSLSGSLYNVFKATVGPPATSGGWDRVMAGKSTNGIWFVGFVLQIKS